MQMKIRILDLEDAGLLAIASFWRSYENDARPRMWFKRQFFELREHISSRRI